MGRPVTQSDVGKPIESYDGTRLGVAASVDDEAVYVEPDAGATDSIKATLGWEHGSADTVPVQQAVIGEVTDDAIRLDSELAVQGGVGTAAGRPPSIDESDEGDDRPAGDPDLEVDPSELTDEEPAAEVGPDEDVGSRTDAEAGRDTGAKRTDAATEPPAEPRREDARTPRSSAPEGEQTTERTGVEPGGVDPMADARRRPTELDERDGAPGTRDEIGEIDEPVDRPDRTDVDEFGDAVDRSETEGRSDVADPAARPGDSEPRDASDVADRTTELDDADDRGADDGRTDDAASGSADSDEESS